MKRISRKTVLILLGVFLSLALLEGALRLADRASVFLRDHRNRMSIRQSGSCRIVCLGEASMAPAGAYPYPAQLEAFLNSGRPGIHFLVYDARTPDMNTFVAAERLERILDTYKPHMVIAMMGANDIFLASVAYGDPPPLKTVSALERSKIFGLIDRFLKALKEGAARRAIEKALGKDPGNDALYFDLAMHYYKKRGEFSKAEALFKKALALNPKNEWAYYQLAACYWVQRRVQESYDTLKALLAVNPGHAPAQGTLGWLSFALGDFQAGEEWLKKAVATNPKNHKALAGLGFYHYGRGDLKTAEIFFKKAVETEPRNGTARRGLVTLYEQLAREYADPRYLEQADKFRQAASPSYHPQTRENFLKIKKALDKRGVKLVCVQYPMRSAAPLKEVFEQEGGVLFVDNEKTFKEAVRKDGYRRYFLDASAGDFGPCTTEGNRLLAQTIADVVLKEYFNR